MWYKLYTIHFSSIFLYAGSLANAVGSLYVTKYFNEDSKTEALMMVSEIRCLHFLSSVCNNTYLPQATI